MGNRFRDWFRQAEADLRHAGNSLRGGDFDWSCFACHQAAEKAVKSVYLKLGMEAWGHGVFLLLSGLPEEARPDDAMLDTAKALDKHYIPTRYPNGLEAGAPVDFYTRDEAERAVGHAAQIIEFCRHQIG